MVSEEIVSKDEKTAEILREIKEAESEADAILDNARKEKESILQRAHSEHAKILSSAEEEAAKARDKKISDFRPKSTIIRDEKLSGAKAEAKKLKFKAEKNIDDAVAFITSKFEELI